MPIDNTLLLNANISNTTQSDQNKHTTMLLLQQKRRCADEWYLTIHAYVNTQDGMFAIFQKTECVV